MEERHFGPVWLIPGENRGKYPFCHSVYIEGPGVLIDPSSDRKRLTQLREHPGVREVWLTHWHEDHLMHLDLFEDLPLCLSEEDAPQLSNIEWFLDGYGIQKEEDRRFWKGVLKEQFHLKPRGATRFLRGGSILSLGPVSAEVLSTPGHTPGHLSFLFKEVGVLFMADYDLTPFGPWYGDVHSSLEATVASVKRLREIPAGTWLTAHETGVFEENPGELWDRYLGMIRHREERLLDLLKEPRTLEDIVAASVIYGRPREPRAFFEIGERGHMKKHLEKCIREGTVVREGNAYVRVTP